MKTLDTGEAKVQKICDLIRKETLDPAKQEAERILHRAQAEAVQILKEAEEEKERIIASSKHKLDEQKNVFHASLQQACAQSLEALKQAVHQKLFNHELTKLIRETTQDPECVSKMIDGLVDALKKEGMGANLEAIISKASDVKQIAAFLAARGVSSIKEENLVLDNIHSGCKVKSIENKLTLDLSEEALKDVFSRYLQSEFRKFLFS